MALEQKLSARLSQRLVMTPSLQQAIKLLQMSKLELVEEVQQELLENPVLEDNQNDADPAPDAKDESSENSEESDSFDDIDFQSYFEDVEGYQPRAAIEIGPDLPTFENTLASATSLTSHLTWQLDLSAHDAVTKEIGRAIIGNLNDDGYLQASLDEIRRMGDWKQVEVERTLEQIQAFDPVGVAARDLAECLSVQLKHLGQAGTAAEIIVKCHMDKLQSRRYKELATALELDMEDLEAEIEIIRGLDPRPGSKFAVQSNNYVVPDVYIVKIDDEYQIILNEEGLPRLRISPIYRRMVARGAADAGPEAKEYVRNKLRAAFRLIKSLEERQRTIYKVATSIVKFQRGFLDHGIEKMRPLVLRDVADDIGMHESTVSRVVNQKYMHTHRGLFEMRFFFHSGISSSEGNSVSSLSVKERIRKIVAGESSKRPYSDAAIVKILKAEGLQIARRTIAKYREELKIPSSSTRRQASLQ